MFKIINGGSKTSKRGYSNVPEVIDFQANTRQVKRSRHPEFEELSQAKPSHFVP
jgi:hypothetical protein